MRVSTANLALLNPSVVVPSYNRAEVAPGILHVGVGNFHRSHMAVYLDQLLQQPSKESKLWGIVGTGVNDSDSWKQRRAALQSQDHLYTLLQRDAGVCEAQVIGSIIDTLPYSPTQMQTTLCNPTTKIVSMTVTEGGYFLKDGGELDLENPQIQKDIQKNTGEPAETLFGAIVQALQYRRENNIVPFAVLSCDNVPHNGDVTKNVVVTLAQAMYPNSDLHEWIETTVGFPNGMVDRITPATGELEIQLLHDTFDLEDPVVVVCEPFIQWVLEDDFPHGRPALETVGVQFVPDVTPYEQMKIRILNGGHASLCYPSALLGLNYVHEALEHPVIGPFLNALERTEIIPTVGPVPDQDLVDYWKIIQGRFANPTVMDRIDRNCQDGADRQPKFIVPPSKDALAMAGGKFAGLALVSAMWCKYCQGKTEAGETIAPNDKIWDDLHSRAKSANTDATAWLGMTNVYGSVGSNSAFVQAFEQALNKVNEHGVEAAMQEYTDSCTN